jgi:TIR domain/inactive STAND
MTRYVFVSHASLDKPALKPLLEWLLAAGLPIWIDRPNEAGLAAHPLLLQGIRGGADWDAEIREAYQGAACVLFLLSRNSDNRARSDPLFREFDYGSANNKLVIARIDGIGPDEMSGLMRIRQALDLFGPNRDRELETLIATLRRFVLRDSAQPVSDARGSPKRFGALLPYLCDRHTQRTLFREAVEDEIARDVVRPQFVFIIGEDSQCADKFNEQLFFIDLPEALRRNQLSGLVDDRLLRWPPDVRPQADDSDIQSHLDELGNDLGDRLGLGWRPGVSLIERRLERQNAALYVYFDFSVSDWHDGHRRLLREWIGWWARLNLTGRRYPIVVSGRFCYAGRNFWRFGGRSLGARVLGRVDEFGSDEIFGIPRLNQA